MSMDVTDFNAEVLVRSRSVPVVADFWAPWCGPCRGLAPVLEALAGSAGGRWVLAKINTEEQPEIAQALEITSLPTVRLYVDGRAVAEFQGAQPELEIRRWLGAHLPSPHAEVIRQARADLAAGRVEAAATALAGVLASEPDRDEARMALAECELRRDPSAVAAVLLPVTPDREAGPTAEALRDLAAVLTANLPAAAVRDRFEEGISALRRGDLDGALEAWIDVLGRDRAYAGEAAAKGVKAVIRWLGHRHPAVERHFRAFSSALHA